MHEEFDLAAALAVLQATPATLSALLGALPEQLARSSERADEWSPAAVVVHLINGERTNWMPRARHILAGVQEPFAPFDRTGLLSATAALPVAELLAMFSALRHANLSELTALKLTPAELQRTGLHPELGAVRLEQLLATWAVHDLNHIGQAVKQLARVQGAAVGPWRRFLAILDA